MLGSRAYQKIWIRRWEKREGGGEAAVVRERAERCEIRRWIVDGRRILYAHIHTLLYYGGAVMETEYGGGIYFQQNERFPTKTNSPKRKMPCRDRSALICSTPSNFFPSRSVP